MSLALAPILCTIGHRPCMFFLFYGTWLVYCGLQRGSAVHGFSRITRAVLLYRHVSSVQRANFFVADPKGAARGLYGVKTDNRKSEIGNRKLIHRSRPDSIDRRHAISIQHPSKKITETHACSERIAGQDRKARRRKTKRPEPRRIAEQ